MAKPHRVSTFIDVGWLIDGLRGQGLPWRLDFAALVDRLAGDRTVTGKSAYLAVYPGDCYPKKAAGQRALMDLMAEQGFEVRVDEMQIRGGMYIDQGVDVMLSVEMLEQAVTDTYDTAIVISRRPTLRPAVEAVRSRGKEVENVFFEYQADPSNEVMSASNGFVPLTEGLVQEFALS